MVKPSSPTVYPFIKRHVGTVNSLEIITSKRREMDEYKEKFAV